MLAIEQSAWVLTVELIVYQIGYTPVAIEFQMHII